MAPRCEGKVALVTGARLVVDAGVTAHTGQPNFTELVEAALARR